MYELISSLTREFASTRIAGELASLSSCAMDNLSEKAAAARQGLRDASDEYNAVIAQVLDNPNGQYVERLRQAQEKVAGAAASWALAYVEGVEPSS